MSASVCSSASGSMVSRWKYVWSAQVWRNPGRAVPSSKIGSRANEVTNASSTSCELGSSQCKSSMHRHSGVSVAWCPSTCRQACCRRRLCSSGRRRTVGPALYG